MKSKILHRSFKMLMPWLIALGLWSWSVSADSSATYVRKTITLPRTGPELISSVIKLSRPFNSVTLLLPYVAKGMEVNFGEGWEPFEAHDDGFGPEAFLLTEPTKTVQFKIPSGPADRLVLQADFFFYEEDPNVTLSVSEESPQLPLKGEILRFAQNDIIGSELYAGNLVTQGGFEMIPREKWGADENIRYWSPDLGPLNKSIPGEYDGSSANPCQDTDDKFSNELQVTKVVDFDAGGRLLAWPLEYTKEIRKIVIHHTDSEIRDINNDNRINSRDYKEIVRAIYRYHAITRGWGDIGYNYLIDPLGNIYEGRYGGDKVVGAHVLCHNNGALGIAIIGNYQDNEVPEPALLAAIALVSQKTKQFKIDPTDSSPFRGKTIPNIVGHKDLRPTACPGEKLYGLLPRIRERVGLAYRGGRFDETLSTETLDYNAEPLSEVADLTLKPNERKQLTLKFRNTGKNPWDQNTWLHVPLNNNPHARVVPLLPEKFFVAAHLLERQVAPGEVGSFEVEIEGGYVGGDYEFEVAPVVNGRYRISRAALGILFKVQEPDFNYEVVKLELPKDIIFQTQKIEAGVELKNTGNITWRNYGANPIRLGTEFPRDHKSIFVKENPARIGYLLDSEVPPGKIGRFALDLEVPLRVEKRVVERFTPVIEGVQWLEDKNMGFSATIKKPIHLARIRRLDPPSKLLPGEMKKIAVEIENKGDLTWNEENMVATLTTRGLTLFKNRLIPREEEIKPKTSGTFDFWIQAPYRGGRHSLNIASKFNRVPIRGGATRMLIDVPGPKLRAQVIDQGERSISLQPGQVKELTVKIKNLGNVVWQREGPNAIYLATAEPQDRKSALFLKNSWVSPKRAARLQEASVGPGETGAFTFSVKSDRKGVYKEYFQLVIERVGWIPGSVARWDFRVFGDKIEGQTEDPLTEARENAKKAEVITRARGDDNRKVVYRPPIVEERPIRIKLSYNAENATFTSPQPFDVTNGEGNKLFEVKGYETVAVKREGSEFRLETGSAIRTSSIVRFTPVVEEGTMEIASWEHRPSWNPALNDNQFRGAIEVRLIGNDVTYINELPLEDYLKGLAEASQDTSLEKMKAIAVLARTYARFYMESENRKFPGLPYDGSDNPDIFQKYLGYGFELRMPQFVGAVALTENEVVTYEGKLVKTPYFNQSDGRTRSAREVWGWTDTPYLQSVEDPWCKGLELRGHGVGLSGCGAEAQAKEGKTYDEIIKYYYQGVEIKELQFR